MCITEVVGATDQSATPSLIPPVPELYGLVSGVGFSVSMRKRGARYVCIAVAYDKSGKFITSGDSEREAIHRMAQEIRVVK